MPHNSNGVFYQDPVAISAGSLTPQIINADVSLPATPFSFESARDAFAQLDTHEFLVTALTGANNDLAFIARLPGDQNLAVRFVDPGANNATLSVVNHAFLTTALTGANNDLTFSAVGTGDTGDVVSVTYVDPAGNNAVEGVVVVGNDITVNLATGSGGAITSTGSTILASIQASAPASALVTVALAVGNSGAGAVTAMTKTNLAGGDIVVNLATGSGGAITSTASQVKAGVEANAAAAALVVVALAPSNTGAGVVTALGTTALLGPTGTSPTLDVTLKHGISSASLVTHSAFAQKTTATSEFKSFATVAPLGQWLFDVGGTSPVFAVSLDVVYRP